MKKLILFGMGGHGISCIDSIPSDHFNIIGYFDEKDLSNTYKYLHLKYLGDDSKIQNIINNYENCYGLISFGNHSLIKKRISLFQKLKNYNLKFTSIVSDNAYVSDKSEIGEGTIIMHKALVNIGVTISENCIINTGTIIDHESRVGENCILSTNVTVNGQVQIGKNTFIGSGTIISNNVTIGQNCIIGAGLTIKKDLIDNSFLK